MNDNIKKIGLAVAVVLILVAGVFFLGKKPVNNQNDAENSNSVTEQKPDPSKMPDFILGKVEKIEGQKVFFKSGAEEKSVLVSASTQIIKQVKEKDGYKNVEAKLGDIKKGVQIVVYYQSINGSEYTANKIQILPF